MTATDQMKKCEAALTHGLLKSAFLFSFLIISISYSRSSYAGHLADSVFSYQSWTSVRAQLHTEDLDITSTAHARSLIRSANGDFKIGDDPTYYEVMHGLIYSSFRNGKMRADQAPVAQVARTFLLARFFSLNATLRSAATIVKEEGDQLWLRFDSTGVSGLVKITADPTGKATRVDVGDDGFYLSDLGYSALPQSMVLTSWTVHFPPKTENDSSGNPVTYLNVRNQWLENITLNVAVTGSTFSAP